MISFQQALQTGYWPDKEAAYPVFRTYTVAGPAPPDVVLAVPDPQRVLFWATIGAGSLWFPDAKKSITSGLTTDSQGNLVLTFADHGPLVQAQITVLNSASFEFFCVDVRFERKPVVQRQPPVAPSIARRLSEVMRKHGIRFLSRL